MVNTISILIAKIASIVFLAVGLGGLFNKDYYKKIVNDTFNNSGIVLAFGFITIIVSFLIVNFHNVWVYDWSVLVTLIGWVGLVKGFFILAYPESIFGFSKPVFSGKLAKILPYTTIILALIFGYFGFFA
ncbi:hypothetical protein KY330_06040 [Candidatus Woesearchaeota archaeon]|nr:hypothetical protein [Candidatus Woesearchaeota archaeon]